MREVAAANAGFYQAFESLDIAEMDEVWAHRDEVKCVHPGWGLLVGWPRVRQSWELIFRSTARMRIELEDVAISGGDATAWVVLTEHVGSDDEGQRTLSPVLATNVFERVDGLWLLVHHHASPAVRMPGPPEPTTVH
ncbi:MAG: nuclear transport factor 2 family protein [Myxococcales bacterium]|nr:nuclear transport factor 2 family protein [Myxococcales bacterium]